MEMKKVLAAASAAVLALSGIVSILVLNHQPQEVEAVELSGPTGDPAIRRQDDDVRSLDAVPDDDDDDSLDGTGDSVSGNAATDDNSVGGNAATGNDSLDGTDDGGQRVAATASTGDGDDTRGDDGTSGGNNTADASRDNSVSNSASNSNSND